MTWMILRCPDFGNPLTLHCHSGSIPRSHRKPRHKSGAKPFCTSQRAPTVEVASNFSPSSKSVTCAVFYATDGGFLK